MDKDEKAESPRRVRRRERLALLVEEAGGASQVARETGTPRSHLSAITGGARGLGDALAAKLEAIYNKPAGWFDIPLSSATEPVEVDLDAHPDLERIRKVKLRLEAGVNGFAMDADETDGAPIFFRSDWLRQRGYKPYHLVAVKVMGQSMEPSLYPGDMVVINTADVEPKDGKVFALNYEGEAVIKRMIRDSGTWWLVSDNPDQRRFPRKECSSSACLIVGLVVHKQSEQI